MSRRDVNPIFQQFRAFLLGRQHTNALRLEEDMSRRTQSPPSIPNGPSHKCSKNYYHTRDARGSVTPPKALMKVVEPEPIKEISKTEEQKKSKKKGKGCMHTESDENIGGDPKTKFRGPGKVFGWDKVYD